MTGRLDPRRLAAVEQLTLELGQHTGPEDGACLMEAASYLAGEPWSDAPECASEVVAGLLRAWNDMLPRRPRQELRRYLPRIVASRGTTAQETARAEIAASWLTAGPGALLRGEGRRLAEAAVASARWHAPDAHTTSPIPLPAMPRRVPRAVRLAMHDLIDRLLAVTETDPAPPVPGPRSEATPTPRPPERIARPRRRAPLRAVPNPRPIRMEQPTE